ncbi:polysaccharide deacetylase family protein [Spirosoma telluris]|uniref:polysaccharide deacetylase family protein n=1 Tax=Spirosoma telluris TaxID=2183553 RepID=UPI002FC2C635
MLGGIGATKHLLRNRPGKRMLMYHGVDAVGSLAYNSRFISAHLFEQQVAYFKENFNIVTLKEYYEADDLPKDKLTITLTFDDGYANNFTRVLPILEKHKVPATFFITAIREKGYAYLWTDFHDMLRYRVQSCIFNGEKYSLNRQNVFCSQRSGELLHKQLRKLSFIEIDRFIQDMIGQTGLKMEDFHPDYYLQMTVEQIALLAKSPYAAIGSHTHTHIDLTQRPMSEIIDEMRFSKEWLETITNLEIDSLAFPYGVYTLEVINAAKTVGYRRQVADRLSQEADANIPELQQRFGNNPFLTFTNQIWCLLNEHYL